MGCASSVRQVSHTRRQVTKAVSFSHFPQREQKDEGPPVELSFEEIIKRDLNHILDGIQPLTIPGSITPIAVSSEDAFPIFMLGFYEDTLKESTSIPLPVIAFSRSEIGQYCVFGNIDFLTHSSLFRTETSAFMENIMIWGMDYKLRTVKVLLFCFPGNIAASLMADLSSFGYFVEYTRELPAYFSSDIIFAPSNLADPEVHEAFEDFTRHGGTVFIFATSSPEIPKDAINPLIMKAGLAVVSCSLTPKSNILKVFTYDKLQERTAPSIKRRLMEELQSEKPDINNVDELVSHLRFYLTGIPPDHSESILEFVNFLWDFLVKDNFMVGSTVCQTKLHEVLAVLLSEIVILLSPHDVTPAPCVGLFPGAITEEVPIKTRSIRIALPRGTMISTGMYLPPGVVGRIESNFPVYVQIGAHDVSLFGTPAPWPRWPVVAMRTPIPMMDVRIASPFGGIVYVASFEPKQVSIGLNGTCRYPRYSIFKEQTWDETKDIAVPWGEIEMHTVTITLPAPVMRRFQSLKATTERLEKAISAVNEFLGAGNGRLRRIVFDATDASSQVLAGECLVFTLDDLPLCIDATRPSTEFLHMLSMIGASTFPEDSLDNDAIVALSTAAACHAFTLLFQQDMNPLKYITGTPPPLFNDIWDVARIKPGAFSQAVLAVTTRRFSPDQKMGAHWDLFTQELKRSSGMDIFKLTDRFLMTRKLGKNASERLSGYQMDPLL